jgi:ABC-2 type transport system ATP-binding protein
MDRMTIRTERLTRQFDTVRAVDDMTLDVPTGIVFGFLGPNGSGKTTTIRLLLGLIAPTRGTAEVLGYDVTRQAEAIRLQSGALLEHAGLYERLSAEDNLDYYGRIAHMPDGDRKARIKELLTAAGLWERRREPVRQWSRGMKQKVAVARTLLHRPSLVFLDEPTAGLDPVAAAALRQDLAELVKRDGTTVFLTTHNLTEAEKLCDRVAVIRRGKILAEGRPDDLRRGAQDIEAAAFIGGPFDSETVARVRLRPEVLAVRQHDGRLDVDLRPGSSVGAIVTLVVSGGAALEEVRRPKATLEDLFLDLVEDRDEARAVGLHDVQ